MGQLGEFVLIIGDLHIPQRAIDIPDKFKELLLPNKMQYVLSPGNIGSREMVEWLQNLASAKSQTHIVRGDFDEQPGLPDTKVVQIGNFKIGLIHGHQVVPWGDLEALANVQRQLDCDILVSGHTHKHQIQTYDGKFFINPGSATGSYSALNVNNTQSFILMAIQGDDVVAFIYELLDGEINVTRTEFSKNQQAAS